LPQNNYALWFSRITQCVFYINAGIAHFRSSSVNFFLVIMPKVIPFKLFFVYLSGAIEILLGLLVLIPSINNIVGWALVTLLVAVFPANLTALTRRVQKLTGMNLKLALVRLPIQYLFIAWAYQLTSTPFSVAVRTLANEVSYYSQLHILVELTKYDIK